MRCSGSRCGIVHGSSEGQRLPSCACSRLLVPRWGERRGSLGRPGQVVITDKKGEGGGGGGCLEFVCCPHDVVLADLCRARAAPPLQMDGCGARHMDVDGWMDRWMEGGGKEGQRGRKEGRKGGRKGGKRGRDGWREGGRKGGREGCRRRAGEAGGISRGQQGFGGCTGFRGRVEAGKAHSPIRELPETTAVSRNISERASRTIEQPLLGTLTRMYLRSAVMSMSPPLSSLVAKQASRIWTPAIHDDVADRSGQVGLVCGTAAGHRTHAAVCLLIVA